MRILLIGINSKYIHPAMGTFQIVANSKFTVSHMEFTIKDSNESIINKIGRNWDLIGFSVYIWNIEKVKSIIQNYPESTTFLLGGPEASYRPELLFYDKRIRFIIKNEGEESFNELIEYLQGKRKISEVSNLYFKENESLSFTFETYPNLKSINHDLSLINDFENRIVYLEASRGCPFRCSYCLSSLEKRVRYFPIEKIKQQIKFALEKKVKMVKFLDRSFNIREDYMQDILRFIQEHDNNITIFQFEIVGELLNEETIALLKKIRKGLIRFEIGIQSTNPKTTRAINRSQDFQKLKKNISSIKDYVILHLDLIAGLPFEGFQSFVNTFNEAFVLGADELQLGFLKELQGTKISLEKEKYDYHFSLTPPYEIISNAFLSPNELDEIRKVELALNIYYNSHAYERTIKYLFSDLKLNPFQVFLDIANYPGFKKTLQIDEKAKLLYYALKEKLGEEILYFIKQDYLMRKPIKPKIWWKNEIPRGLRQEIYQKFIEKYPDLDLNYLYRYGHLEKYQDKYFLVTYHPHALYHLS